MAESLKYMGWSKRFAAAQAREQARKASAPIEAIRNAHNLKRTAKMDFEAGKMTQDAYELFVLEQDEVIVASEKAIGVAPKAETKVETKPEAKPELKFEERPRKAKLELPKIEKPIIEE